MEHQQQTLGEMTLEEFLLKSGVLKEEFHEQKQHQQDLGEMTLEEMTLEEFLVKCGVVGEEFHHQPVAPIQRMIEPMSSGNLPPGFNSTTCRSVYVGNIHLQVTEALLHEIFQIAGPVEGCKLVRKEKSSFGFIDYFEHMSAGRAILILDGKHLYGQPLKVTWMSTSGQREDTSDGSKPEIPSSNVNIQLVQGKMDNNRLTELELKKFQLSRLEPNFPNEYKIEESSGDSSQKTSEEEHTKRSDGSQFSSTFAKWSSLKVRYSDIKDATNGLSESSKIGKGGYGSVYKGKLSRTMVAIKMLDSTSKQGENEFLQELEVLYQMRHPNLVKLIGACFEVRALVYELLPNGSLEDFLECSPNILTWQMRTRIIYEICSALIYLHSRSVVHGDLKPANILLDANFKSKISDFGLCRFLPVPEGMTTDVYLETVPKGTSGYIDPWFLETWILRPGSDLYSFGITILKLLTRLPPVGLGVKARDADENSFRKMIDPTAGSWPFELAKELLYWSLQCCYHNEKSSELLEEMSTCLEEMLTEIETLKEGRFKAVVRWKKTDEDLLMAEEMKEEKPKVEEKKERMVIAVVLKVHMHCEDCAQEIKKRILRMKGVKAVEPQLKTSLVTVKGVFDQLELVEYVHHMSGGMDVTIVKVEPVAKKPEENEGKGEEKIKDEKNNGEEDNDELLPEDLKIEQKRKEFYYHP